MVQKGTHTKQVHKNEKDSTNTVLSKLTFLCHKSLPSCSGFNQFINFVLLISVAKFKPVIAQARHIQVLRLAPVSGRPSKDLRRNALVLYFIFSHKAFLVQCETKLRGAPLPFVANFVDECPETVLSSEFLLTVHVLTLFITDWL